MSWLGEDIPDVELIAKILSHTKTPTSQRQIREIGNLSAWGSRLLLDSLMKCHMLKPYAQQSGKKEDDQQRLFITAPKGHELLRCYRSLLKILGLNSKDPKALQMILCKEG